MPARKGPGADLKNRNQEQRILPRGQPPAAVLRAYSPVGQFQLYRLGRRVRFYCDTCRQRKTANLVATTKGDWSHTICNSCYLGQVNAQRGKAKKATQPIEYRVSAMKEPSRKVKLKRAKRLNGSSANPVIAKGEHQQLRRGHSGLDGMLGFFRAAGINAELGRDGCLWINGTQTEHLAQLPSPETPDWINLVNEIALKYVRDKFISAVEENARFGDGVSASPLPSERGFAIMRDDMRLAVIHPAHASIPHRPFIYANFLVPGAHWQQVANALHDAEADMVAERKRERQANAAVAASAVADARRRHAAAQRRIEKLPDDLSPKLIKASLDASRRIRLERQVAYDRPVILECDVGELTLLPIAGTETRLFIPFRLKKGTETMQGELVLGDRDPLPLLIGRDVPHDDAIKAWTCALLGFADATCIELEPTEPTMRVESARQRRPVYSASRRRPSTTAVPRTRRWPRHLEPVGRWIHYSGSFVAGHRRRLNDGKTATPEARDRARRLGIILHSHETWVRPHARGIPDGIDMRFRWHTPTELKLLRSNPRA